MKEKALRDTQITSIHDMGELKRAQELRVVEFSAQKLRESHDTIQRLTSQIQKYKSAREGELHVENFSRSQTTSSHSKSSFYATPRQTLATSYMEFV